MQGSILTSSRKFENAEDWMYALGDVPLKRVVMDPWPGTATEQDVLTFADRDDRLLELIDGTLVEKPAGWWESVIATRLAAAVGVFVAARRLGYITGASGPIRMNGGHVRLPDMAFLSIEDLPGRPLPREAIPTLSPTLVAEVLRIGSTEAEIQQKLRDYFASGTRLAWILDPLERTIAIYNKPSDEPTKILHEFDTFDGGTVLPGFQLSIAELFSPRP